jgi:hypothetical protein
MVITSSRAKHVPYLSQGVSEDENYFDALLLTRQEPSTFLTCHRGFLRTRITLKLDYDLLKS